MRGTIKSRTPGSYSIIASYKDADGKRKQVWRTLHCNKKEAEQKLRELLVELDHGVIVKSGKATVETYLNSWLSDYCRPNLAKNTYQLYAMICRKHIVPAIGVIALSDLSPMHLQKLYADKLVNSNLSTRTVQIIHVIIHKSLVFAVKTGLLSRNVADIVERPKSKSKPMQTMNDTDYILFLERAKEEEPEYHALFYTYLYTGLRRNEALALRWLDVDLLESRASINRTLEFDRETKQFTYKEPKTASSRRMIDLTPSNVVVLREHREVMNRRREILKLPSLTDDDLIFSHWDGTPLLPNTITMTWLRLARRCGLNGIHVHSARHSHASILAQDGVPLKVISERLGHTNTRITQDLYMHVTRGMQKEAAKIFDAHFSKNLVSKPLANLTITDSTNKN